MLIVHLDTSFLSQLAKLEMGTHEVPYADQWKTLLTSLREEVQLGSLICPVSEFQLQEALLSPGLVSQITGIQSELSRGHFFRDWESILVHQAANQVLTYLGRPEDIDPVWDVLIRDNPGIVHPRATMNAKEDTRHYAEELQRQGIPKRSFAEQYEVEKTAFVQESFLNPVRQVLGLPVYSRSPDSKLIMLLMEAKVSEDEVTRVIEFFNKPNLLDQIPYIRVFCSLYASLQVNEPRRKPQSGDLLDVAAMSCVIPYCAIVTTDTNMKTHLVERLHFHTDYEMQAFAPTVGDIQVFLEMLSAIRNGQ